MIEYSKQGLQIFISEKEFMVNDSHQKLVGVNSLVAI